MPTKKSAGQSKPRKFKGTSKKKEPVLSSKEKAFMNEVVDELGEHKKVQPSVLSETKKENKEVVSSDSSMDKATTSPDLQSRMDTIFRVYKQEEKISKTSIFRVLSIGFFIILIVGTGGYFLSKTGKEQEKTEQEETTNSERVINWDDFEASVEQKRLESDLEFEKMKEEGGETTTTEEENSHSETETSSTTQDFSNDKEDLSNIEALIDSSDTEILEYPVDFTLNATINEPEE